MSSSIVNLFGINIANPVFKKGSKDTLPISNYGTQSSGTLTYTYTCDELLESDVKEISYCALDKDGKIIGNFTSSGNASVGFTGNDDANLNKIDTYVIVLGCYATNSDTTDCWVTDVKFNYKAEAGYGGTFGTVGYRDTPNTIENTILNFHIEMAAGSVPYTIIVYFDQDTMSYHITAYANADVSLRIYNYYPDTYSLYVSTNSDGSGETQYTGSSVTISLSGT